MLARVKLKGIDGGPHKRWSMWFNSMQREEPYQDLTCHFFLERESSRVNTGGAWLSSARVLRCWVKSRNERNPCFELLFTGNSKDCRWEAGGRWGWRQVSMPLTSWATHVLQWSGQRDAILRGGANLKNPISVRIVGCNSPTWSRNR